MTRDPEQPEPAAQTDADIFRIGQTMTRMRVMMGRRMIGRIAIARAAPGLDLSQLDILEVVVRIRREGGEATVGAIADAMRIDPSRGSRLVAELVSQGILKRDASQEDGRRSLIAPTEAGEALLTEIRAVKHAIVAQATRTWLDEERQAFSHLFERFLDGFEQIFQAGDGPEDAALPMAAQPAAGPDTPDGPAG